MKIPEFAENLLKKYFIYAVISIGIGFAFLLAGEGSVSILCFLMAAYMGFTIYDLNNGFQKSKFRIFTGNCLLNLSKDNPEDKKRKKSREFKFQIDEDGGEEESFIIYLRENQKLRFIEGETYDMVFKGHGEPNQVTLVLCERRKQKIKKITKEE